MCRDLMSSKISQTMMLVINLYTKGDLLLDHKFERSNGILLYDRYND